MANDLFWVCIGIVGLGVLQFVVSEIRPPCRRPQSRPRQEVSHVRLLAGSPPPYDWAEDGD